MKLNLRPAEECTFDAVSLGEVMLRLDPGEGRIRTARSFRAWEGGGEYNVIRALHKCFGMRTAVITSFADNEVGLLMKDFIEQGGVDTSLICWKKTDGIGRLAEMVSTSQKEDSVSVVPRVAQIELTQLFLRLLQKISTLITSSRTRAMAA